MHSETNERLQKLFAYMQRHELPVPMAVFVVDATDHGSSFELRYATLDDMSTWWKRCRGDGGSCSGSYARGTMRLATTMSGVGRVSVDVALQRTQRIGLAERYDDLSTDAVHPVTHEDVDSLLGVGQCEAEAGVRGDWKRCEIARGRHHEIHQNGTLRWLGSRTLWGDRDNHGRPSIWNKTA